MSNHAWCRDPSRDERVRAAEDGRDRPLPTLEECIETAFSAGVRDSFRKVEEAWAMIPKSVSASSAVEQENKGDGMRTERVTLDVVHGAIASINDQRWWDNRLWIEPQKGESVRVVSDEERELPNDRILAASKKLIEFDQEAALRGFDTTTFQRLWISAIARVLGLELARPPRSKCDNPGDGSIPSPGILASPALVEAHQQIAALTAERDAAIRERDEMRKSWLRSEESGTRLLAERNAALDDADGLRKRVAELEAASGGEHPRGWLTGEEREALESARLHLSNCDGLDEKSEQDARWASEIVAKILARSTPPSVVPVPLWKSKNSQHQPFMEELMARRDAEWIAALAAAGVEVELPPGPEGDG